MISQSAGDNTEKCLPLDVEQGDGPELLDAGRLLFPHSFCESPLMGYLSPPPDHPQDLPQMVSELGTPLLEVLKHTIESWC